MFRKYKAIMLTVLLVIIFGILPNSFMTTVKAADSKTWINVGTPRFSKGMYPKLSMTGGTPYVAFVNSSNKMTVMKYSGIKWEQVGDIPSQGNVSGLSLYVSNGTPYVSFYDFGDGTNSKLSVMEYIGGSWQPIGTPNFSTGIVNETSINVAGGIPYVAIIDQSSRITLEEYTGGSWQPVGSVGFSDASRDLTLYIYNGIPYVSFRNGDDGNAELMKYYEGSWQTVGNPYISPSEAEDISLAMDSNGTPYVAYRDNGYYLTVREFDGTKWNTLGDTTPLTYMAEYTSVSVSSNGTPYVAYKDGIHGGGVAVAQYSGGKWQTLGSGVLGNAVNSDASCIYAGIPYVAFCEGISGPNLTVMKYAAIEPPTASLAGGVVSSGTLLTLTDSAPGANIYYTLDGTDPSTASTHYTSGITINTTGTIKAIAVKDNLTSSIMSATYKVNSSISPTSSSFDKYSGADINVNMALNGNTLSSIKNGTASLLAGTDYIVSGSTVTIKKEYLKGLATGTVNLTFSFNAGNNQSINITINDTPRIDLSQTGTYIFTAQTAGYSPVNPQSITIIKTGTGNITGLSAALSGTYKDDFTLTTPEAVTLDNTTTSTAFTIKPNDGLTAGTYTATVTVTADNGINKNFDVSFTVNAPAPTYTIDMSQTGTYIFTAQTAGYSPVNPQSITIIKTGTGNITGLSAALSGTYKDDFTLTTPEAVTLDNTTTSTAFTIKPNDGLTAGTYTATVSVTADNGINKSFDVSFTVNAPAPTYTIDLSQTGTYIFSAQTAGYSPVNPQSITISKIGTGNITNLSVALSGTYKDDFTLTAPGAVTLDNTTTSTAFTIKPNDGLAAGTYTATVTVTADNGVSTSFDVSFTVNPVHSNNGGNSGESSGSDGTSQGSGAAVPGSSGKTVIGNAVDGITGNQISSINATVTTDSSGNTAVSMDAAQAVVLKQTDGSASSLTDIFKVSIETAAGSPITVSSDGKIQVSGLTKGSDNNFAITYDLGNGQKITIGNIKIKVASDGNVSLTSTLIDPYGTITDAATGKAVDGVNMTLYYANTDRNKATGKIPDTVVSLPGIDGFKPNNNKNPQVSDSQGQYGFMVFPNSDYYLVAAKAGYNKYTSPVISVEKEIVKWDFKMSKTNLVKVQRLSGATRVDTALAISEAAYTGKVSNVILTTADNYPDALTGSVLAYKLNGPILLIGSSDEDQQKVLDYMKRNMDTKGTVYILGGNGAINKNIETKVTAAGFSNISRISGLDRYETSVKIAEAIGAGTGKPLILAYGEDYPDSLSVSSAAAVNEYPILLVNKNEIPECVKKEIVKLNPNKIYIIGLQGAISDKVESEAQQITSLNKANIIRIGGENRLETSLEIAKYFNMTGNTICAATENNFPDALAGSIYAAQNNASIILTDSKLSDGQITYLKGKKLLNVTLFGGEGAVSKDVQQELSQILGE